MELPITDERKVITTILEVAYCKRRGFKIPQIGNFERVVPWRFLAGLLTQATAWDEPYFSWTKEC
jgi:hypothetical protein